jgi:hypothetical protein
VRRERERGTALVEFALMSLVLYLLLAATIEFGRLMFSAQGIQDVARLAARELAVAPLPANITFEDALTYVDPVSGTAPVLDRIFNPACLVVNVTSFAGDDDALDAFFAAMPLVNRALRPLMIADLSTGVTLLRYPGALLTSNNPAATCAGRASPYTVGIPRVIAPRGPDGEETFNWIPVLQEIRDPITGPLSGPFSLAVEGVVAIRMNYPYQAATMAGFRQSPDGPFEKNLRYRIIADDPAVAPIPPNGTVLPGPDPNDEAFHGPYAGSYGLGRLASPLGNGQGVRPFRKLLAAQAIYRREVFQ